MKMRAQTTNELVGFQFVFFFLLTFFFQLSSQIIHLSNYLNIQWAIHNGHYKALITLTCDFWIRWKANVHNCAMCYGRHESRIQLWTVQKRSSIWGPVQNNFQNTWKLSRSLDLFVRHDIYRQKRHTFMLKLKFMNTYIYLAIAI